MGSYVIILAAVFALMWLLLIRPQRRKQLAQSRMQDSVEVGDDVLTAGGIHGTVREIEGEPSPRLRRSQSPSPNPKLWPNRSRPPPATKANLFRLFAWPHVAHT